MQTLAGFDWIRRNLTRKSESNDNISPTATQHSKIGVCGELVGGSLAAMLALTECREDSTGLGINGISAAAIGNPIVDWTGLFGTDSDPLTMPISEKDITRAERSSSSTTNAQPMSISGLSAARNSYFAKPDAYFDPFASPLLFFRTPASELPFDQAASLGYSGGSEPEDVPTEPVRKRRSARKHPPSGSKLRLPLHVRVEVGRDSTLKD